MWNVSSSRFLQYSYLFRWGVPMVMITIMGWPWSYPGRSGWIQWDIQIMTWGPIWLSIGMDMLYMFRVQRWHGGGGVQYGRGVYMSRMQHWVTRVKIMGYIEPDPGCPIWLSIVLGNFRVPCFQGSLKSDEIWFFFFKVKSQRDL